MIVKRNDIEYFKLSKFTEDTVEREAIICNKQLRASYGLKSNNLTISQYAVGIQYVDYRIENGNNAQMRFYVGNSVEPNLSIQQTEGVNIISLNRPTECSHTFKANTFDTFTDTDMVLQRNGVEYFRLDDFVGVDCINVASDKGLTSSYIYCHSFNNRGWSVDTVFYGSNVAGDVRVEYMRWNYTNQKLDFNAPIDNTGISAIGNLVNTTPSDERLKTNIQDIDVNYSDCVKNTKIKTFEYKNEKYKNMDKYGMIAQDLLHNLPNEFQNIVKENKDKHSDDKYFSVDYMRLSVVLWGCLQEEMAKTEYLESKLFETIARVEALEKPKPKAKAKSKNLD